MKSALRLPASPGLRKRQISLVIGALVLLCLVTACVDETPRVTVGKEFPIERSIAIKRHDSTTKDVLELLGEPYRETSGPGRLKRWRYYSRTVTKKAILFFFEGETQVKEDELIIVFDGTVVQSIKRSSDTYNE